MHEMNLKFKPELVQHQQSNITCYKLLEKIASDSIRKLLEKIAMVCDPACC